MSNLEDQTWRFLDDAPTVESQDILDDLFGQTVALFGIDRFDCGRISASGPGRPTSMLGGRGLHEWVRHYTEQNYIAVDPCRSVFPYMRGAYTWSEALARSPGALADVIWSDARADGMGEGLLVPVSPGRTTAPLVRLTTPESQLPKDTISLLQSLAIVYATATLRLEDEAIGCPPGSKPSHRLTEREIECLHWVARAKTNSEVAALMRISPHTVNTHIDSAKRKLGVHTRVQAASIAYRLGLLSLD